MVDKFLRIAITSPDTIENECRRICGILHNDEADIIHIRKPFWTDNQIETLLRQIPSEYYQFIKLHDHYSMLDKFPLLGVHLNSRNLLPPKKAISISRSLHKIEELALSQDYDYVTLSPIFDSISKQSYKTSFSLDELKPFLKGKRVIALGGITPDKFNELKEAGFIGAAMLGHFWKD